MNSFILCSTRRLKKCCFLTKGLPAGPGGASGQIVFTANDAVNWAKEGKKVILIREETNPEDIEGMRRSTGHSYCPWRYDQPCALVARGWGKCCIVGAADVKINFAQKTVAMGNKTLKEGDWISLNGTKGLVYEGKLAMVDASENKDFVEFMKIVDKYRKLKVRTNADTPEDAARAREFGAEGIGLFRTEHMFYGKNSEQPLFKLRKMIISKTEKNAVLLWMNSSRT
jgi:pyruvate,orthophosphate dikinase